MLIDTLKFRTRLIEGGFQDNEAQALVEAMSEASTEHFATKTDIGDLKAEIADLRGDLKADIANLRGETKAEIADLRGDLKADIANLRGETKADIANLRGETKADIQVVRTEMENMRGQIMNIKWIVTTLLIVNLGILGKLLFT